MKIKMSLTSAVFNIVDPPEHIRQCCTKAKNLISLLIDFLLEVTHAFAQGFILVLQHLVCKTRICEQIHKIRVLEQGQAVSNVLSQCITPESVFHILMLIHKHT